MPFNIGAPELLIILVLALIIFGPGRLPAVGSALGRTFREFRRSSNDLTADLRTDEPKRVEGNEAEQAESGSARG